MEKSLHFLDFSGQCNALCDIDNLLFKTVGLDVNIIINIFYCMVSVSNVIFLICCD